MSNDLNNYIQCPCCGTWIELAGGSQAEPSFSIAAEQAARELGYEFGRVTDEGGG